jgi:hypothetical protein
LDLNLSLVFLFLQDRGDALTLDLNLSLVFLFLQDRGDALTITSNLEYVFISYENFKIPYIWSIYKVVFNQHFLRVFLVRNFVMCCKYSYKIVPEI